MQTIGHVMGQLRDTGIEELQEAPAGNMNCQHVLTICVLETFECAPRFMSWTCNPCRIGIERWSSYKAVRSGVVALKKNVCQECVRLWVPLPASQKKNDD